MYFRGLLRPGQGFKAFSVLRKKGGTTATGRPKATELLRDGEFYGIISQASQKEIEQWKQNGHPITHTIVQRGTKDKAKAEEILELKDELNGTKRRFKIKGVNDPGELGHFTIYHVEERNDLQ